MSIIYILAPAALMAALIERPRRVKVYRKPDKRRRGHGA